jgi:hypothetical protein
MAVRHRAPPVTVAHPERVVYVHGRPEHESGWRAAMRLWLSLDPPRLHPDLYQYGLHDGLVFALRAPEGVTAPDIDCPSCDGGGWSMCLDRCTPAAREGCTTCLGLGWHECVDCMVEPRP